MFKDFILFVAGCFIVLVGVMYLMNIFVEYQCHSTWKLSKFKTSYSFSTGCLIEVAPNVWLPSKNYREI